MVQEAATRDNGRMVKKTARLSRKPPIWYDLATKRIRSLDPGSERTAACA